MPQPWGRVKLTEVNPHLACVLCHGYFVDATTMAECPHSFCRSCIILYLETKSYCPICEVQIHKTKPHLNLKPDKTLQDIVYKLVPGLFHEEMKRRREFYAKHPNRDLYLSPEARGVGVDRIIYSPEDNISLSLEYYDDDREREEWSSARPGTSAEALIQLQKPSSSTDRDGLKRYLLCPANVNMGLLKKFIRLKYGLSQACTVEILYRRESLPDSYSLMDIAYIYTWKRNGPIRFYYRIHVPTPLRANLPPLTPSSEPIREPETKKLKSPELLDAVGLRPKPPELRPVPKLDLDSVLKKEVEEKSPAEVKKEEARPTITTAEDTAVSLLLALSNGVGPKMSPPEVEPAPQRTEENVAKPSVTTESAEGPKPATGNGGGFKVPQSLTKRFVFNGGKLVAVKSKSSGGGKTGKLCEKTKVNGKFNGESTVLSDRFTNPLGLAASGSLGLQSGRLPPGSPRPPPNAEKILKTKYMSASGLTLNWPNPELTVSQNVHRDRDVPSKTTVETSAPSHPKSNSTTQLKATSTGKSPVSVANGQPIPHRKEVNRLEQIVQNCLKKEASQKVMIKEVKSVKELGERTEEKESGPPNENAGTAEDARAAASICSDHGTSDSGRVDSDSKPAEEGASSILKRKLNDPPFNRRPDVQHNRVAADAKKRRQVTPDVSIELMANPAKEKLQKERKRKPSDLSTLTERFLHDIKRMKKLDTELKISKIDQMCASTVKIEKVPAPPVQTNSTPNSSPGVGDKTKAIDCNDFSSEEDQLFIDIRNKCEALKKKKPEPASIAIERVTEVQTTKPSQSSPIKLNDSPSTPVREETPPKSSSTHKKLPRLIEINAPPRPKLPTVVPDPKQKTGVKMTTVRKEVPIGKEGPLVRKDCTGALDLSSGMSPPGAPKNGNKSPFQRPPSIDKSPTPSSLSPLMAMTTFPSPDVNRASPIRIPTLKPKSSPNPRPSSLSSSSPSPPAEPRSNADVFPTAAYHQLYRHQIELQSRLLASQVNNNWSRDPLSAKKFEEWMRNVMNLPHHPLMLPSQLSPETGRK